MIVKNVEKKENNTATFDVEIDAAAFEAAVNRAYLKNRKQISVPGFRKGKAPRMVIEGMYGKDVFYDEAVNDIAPEALSFAEEQEKLDTVGRPTIKNMDVSSEKVLTLSFEVALYPKVTLGQYKGLEVEREKTEITDAEVDAEIARVQKRNARIMTAERPAAMGDTAVIDFEGFLEGVAFDGGKGENHSLVLGSHSFIPGFEEQVVGMSAGEEKDIDVTFPEEYHADLAGKPAVFHVKCHEVKESILPELDDEFAKDVSEFDTLAEYRESIRKNLQETREKNVERSFREAVLQKAAELITVEIPDAMVDEQHEIMIRDYANSLMNQGIELEQYIAMMGMDMDTFRMNTRPSAARQLRVNLMLDAVAEAEGFEVTDVDIEAELQKMADAYKLKIEDVRAAVPVENLRKDILERKAADLICDAAIPTEPKPAEEPKEEPKEEPAE